jgi:uncharacterized protein
MANALARETSPYLRQHAGNPVGWLPWGDEALRRARERDVPLLVSIGYSACHWCHVMERESFEDPAVARIMDEHFVCVKVDREERPDVDALYMEAVQSMTGHGGWPLHVFTTPEGVPFYGGTYFPPQPRHGMPAWPQVLLAVAEAWRERREEIEARGPRMVEALRGGARLRPSGAALGPELLEAVVATIRRGFDAVNGGFGGAPKFPQAPVLLFLLDRADGRPMAVQTLRSMASGGINDQVGGGFARYSVDATWTVPHFEKMLYDNALLLRALHRAGEARTARETAEFLLRELRSPDGPFWTALDADSEGVEGRFYVWSLAELRDVLGADADAAIAWLGATEQGNFEGANVLESRGAEPPAEQRERIRAALLQARAARVRPGLDDKVLTGPNGLAIGALAEAGFVAPAREAAAWLLEHHVDEDGRLLRTGRIRGVLEDHAFLLEGLLDLHEATFEARWYEAAVRLGDELLARFADPEHGGFFTTADDAPVLVARRKDVEDNPAPAGGSSAALGLLRLAALSGEGRYEDAALGQIALVRDLLGRHPQAFGHLLQAAAFALAPRREVALAGEAPDGPLAAVAREHRGPGVVLTGGAEGAVPLLRDRPLVDGRPTAYVCERFACRRPVAEPEQLRALLAP